MSAAPDMSVARGRTLLAADEILSGARLRTTQTRNSIRQTEYASRVPVNRMSRDAFPQLSTGST